MVFSSAIYIYIFFPTVIIFYYLLHFLKRDIKVKNVLLTLVSLVFYAWGEPRNIILLLLSIILNWSLGLWASKSVNSILKRKVVIAVALILNLGILFVFKYLNFCLTNINFILERIDISINISDIALPIGISFFTFQAISYVVDVARGKEAAQNQIINVALYISFFPQLIAGPIVRYNTISKSVQSRKETFALFSEGICKFVLGLSKKVLLANTLAVVADKAFTTDNLSTSFAWLGAIAYTFQIYYDFSGYSDMAIGLGKVFGFQFEENFNFPYISKSISEFWRRWHISLGQWFRDYVYFPLGGSRVSKREVARNLFIVWLLTGIWHGANWTFICWGLMYFVLILLEKYFEIDKKMGKLSHLYCMFFVIIGWVLFRADSIGNAIIYIRTMFGLGVVYSDRAQTFIYLREYGYYFLFAAWFAFPGFKKDNKIFSLKVKNILYILAMVGLFFISNSFILKGSYNPFIYFNF